MHQKLLSQSMGPGRADQAAPFCQASLRCPTKAAVDWKMKQWFIFIPLAEDGWQLIRDRSWLDKHG
jgi:hypothetical protein